MLVLGALPASAVGESETTVNNGLPVLTINIDETVQGYGTIAEMNGVAYKIKVKVKK